ncbi:hypothetical protein D3C77_470100 [compost metagenome]
MNKPDSLTTLDTFKNLQQWKNSKLKPPPLPPSITLGGVTGYTLSLDNIFKQGHWTYTLDFKGLEPSDIKPSNVYLFFIIDGDAPMSVIEEAIDPYTAKVHENIYPIVPGFFKLEANQEYKVYAELRFEVDGKFEKLTGEMETLKIIP